MNIINLVTVAEKRNNLINKDRGATLLEVMIALVIFGFAMLSLAMMQVMAIQGNSFGIDMTTATNIAQSKLEELRTISYDDVTSGEETATDKLGITYSLAWEVTDDIPVADSKRVVLTVQWRGHMGNDTPVNRTLRFSTVISKLP